MIELVIVSSRLPNILTLPYGCISRRCSRRPSRHQRNSSKEMPTRWAFSCARFSGSDPLDAQAAYSELFDRGRATLAAAV